MSAPPRTRASRAVPLPPRPPRAPRPRPARQPQGLLPAALTVSVLLHLLVLLLFRFHLPGPGTAPAAAPSPYDDVMRAVQILPVDEETVAAAEPVEAVPVRPEIAQFPDPELPPSVAAPAQPADVPQTTRPPSVADRLTGRTADPRLYSAPRPAPFDRDEEVRERVAGRLEAWNDSMAAAGASAAAARDWTVRDGEGNRWGISPGRIHLGKFTIPLGSDTTRDVFQPPPDRRDGANARLREWQEIQDQARRAETRAIFDERVKEIRERKEAERKKNGGGGGTGGQ